MTCLAFNCFQPLKMDYKFTHETAVMFSSQIQRDQIVPHWVRYLVF